MFGFFFDFLLVALEIMLVYENHDALLRVQQTQRGSTRPSVNRHSPCSSQVSAFWLSPMVRTNFKGFTGARADDQRRNRPSLQFGP